MKIIACLLFCFISLTSIGQFKGYEEYYQFPINPGEQSYLAGTVGEIRSSHFHTGIDVKTLGQIGLPVYAITDGYISRIKISTSGYGHALYMAHPNGTFSVYAHLDEFASPIAGRIRDLQYEKESYEVELFPEKNEYSFQKGEVIGYSGNTGSSSGPHLHFEIRDKDQNPLDLLRFGFNEIKDNIAPIVNKVAFTCLDEDARVNNLFGRYVYDLRKEEGVYTTNSPINLTGKIGVEIYSYDPMNDIPNRNGIVKTIMLVDSDTLFYEVKDKLSFSRQRNILKHYNYEVSKRGGRRFNRLYRAEGNEHNIYKITNGGVDFGEQKEIRILLEDSYGNQTKSTLKVNQFPSYHLPKVSFRQTEIVSNILHIKASTGAGIRINEWVPISPYFSDGEYEYFTWDLSRGLPNSIFIDGETISTDYLVSVPPKQKLSYHHKDFEVFFRARSLFDTLNLKYKKEYDSLKHTELFRFQNVTDPIRSTVKLKLIPEREYDNEKARIYAVLGKKTNYVGGEWQENKSITFETRDLLTYTILEDTIPPKVQPKNVSFAHNSFQIKDELSGIKSYRAELNGSFIVMRYEPKKSLIWPVVKNPNIPLKGEFKLEVTDNSNNKTIYETKL